MLSFCDAMLDDLSEPARALAAYEAALSLASTNSDAVLDLNRGLCLLALHRYHLSNAYSSHSFRVEPLMPPFVFAINIQGAADTESGKAIGNISGRLVFVDIDVDANYDGKIDDADEPLEEDPGGLVCVCTNSLTRIELKVEPAGLTGKVTLEAPEGGQRIRIWQNTNCTGQITLPKTWDTDALPGTLYIEGVTNSATARDVEIKLEYAVDQPGASGEGERCKDKARLTVIKLDLKEVSFSGTKCHAVKKDDGSKDYTVPHWQDNSSPLDGDADDAGDKKYPVCFTRNTKMKVTAKWRTQPVSPAVTIKVKGDGPGNLDFPETTAAISGNDLTITDVECSNPFANKVGFFDPLEISWQFSVNNGATWLDAGTSANQTYVTLGDPLTTVYHTLVHLGCKNADDQSVDDRTADAIYTEFTGRVVHRVSDNKQMTYWRDVDSDGHADMGATETSDILKRSDANGNCQAWSALYRDFLRVQGINADRINARPAFPDTSILVKNWKFGKHIRTGSNGLRDTDIAGDDVALFAKGNGLPNTVCVQAGTNLITTVEGDDVAVGSNINTGLDGICNTTKAGNDVQVIPVGNGSPNAVCITSGINGVINSIVAGDDVLAGNTVLTGPDGICQTAAVYDDVQVIAVGKGQANTVCINEGVNLVTAPAGDDIVDGTEINTGSNGKCETAKTGNDLQVIPVGQGQPDTPCIGTGPDGTLNSSKQGDDIEQDGVFAGTTYPYAIGFDGTGQPGIEGQGNPDPPDAFNFNGHWITLYNSQYYDPSYGTPKVTGTNKGKVYEDGCLDGFGTVGGRCRKNDVSPSSPSELNYQVDN